MFGFKNYRGSCWVNACLQGLFRIPELQDRYNNKKTDLKNEIDKSLELLWLSKGTEGLKQFFDSVKHTSLPTGRGTADSHELLVYLLDELQWLDDLCRFKIADKITCTKCTYESIKQDTKIELSLFPEEKSVSISDCILKEVTEFIPENFKCEKCQEQCKKQLLIGTFPKILILHVYTGDSKQTNYSSKLLINSKNYGLLSILCYNGAHWWSYGRDNIGKSWFTLDDTTVKEHGPNEFPLSKNMRILIYYRLDE
jgi:ubiquitin C-terminal hydrolase